MKLETIPSTPVFTPVKVEITFETQEELDFFGSLFNCSAVHETWRNFTGNTTNSGGLSPYMLFQKAGANIRQHRRVWEMLRYHLGFDSGRLDSDEKDLG